uniref:Uncharacterized protein n=1 Tax=Anopheles christyi TaxID=43041 RepID=A0A182KHY6_9DIPT
MNAEQSGVTVSMVVCGRTVHPVVPVKHVRVESRIHAFAGGRSGMGCDRGGSGVTMSFDGTFTVVPSGSLARPPAVSLANVRQCE